MAAEQEGNFQITNLFKPEPIYGGNLDQWDFELEECKLARRHRIVQNVSICRR
jgi:hypothetical protein